MSKKNYNKMYTEPTQVEHIDDVVEEIEEMIEPEQESEPEHLIGKVVNCPKLNVRVAPNVGATVAKEIVKGTEVMVYPAESTDDFYKICTESGVEGFCMKQYIAV